jgi:hypothetical protein
MLSSTAETLIPHGSVCLSRVVLDVGAHLITLGEELIELRLAAD